MRAKGCLAEVEQCSSNKSPLSVIMFVDRFTVIPRRWPRVPKANLDPFLLKKGRMPRRASWIPVEKIRKALTGRYVFLNRPVSGPGIHSLIISQLSSLMGLSRESSSVGLWEEMENSLSVAHKCPHCKEYLLDSGILCHGPDSDCK